MSDEPTELDKSRAGYVDCILQAVHDPGNADGGRYMIDELLKEWGAKAYRQGRVAELEAALAIALPVLRQTMYRAPDDVSKNAVAALVKIEPMLPKSKD